jgi:uroporphyrinogen-III synthase
MSVGPKTTATLNTYGIKVNHEPKNSSSIGVGEEFSQIHAVGKKVIIPRSGASNSFLKELLNKIGINVVEIHLYDVCAFRDTTQWNGFRELFSQDKIDGIIFTSASSVRGFFEIMTKDYEMDTLLENLKKLSLVSIGQFTSNEFKKFKVKNTVAEVHTVVGAFDAMKNTLSA